MKLNWLEMGPLSKMLYNFCIRVIIMHFKNSIPSCKYSRGYKPLTKSSKLYFPKYFVLHSRTFSIL